MSIFYMDYVNGLDATTATPYGWWSIAYTGGTGTAPAADETVTGATSGATAKLTVVVAPTSGSWAGNDAAGTMYFYGKSGTFQSEQVNTSSGHFHITADFTYCAWKTITDGATAARIAPADEIRIAKSPDPVSLGNATWTDNSETVTLANALTKNIETCEANWTASANVTPGTTSGKEGTNCITLQFAAGFTTGLAAYKAFDETSFADYDTISFWIQTNSDVAANTFRLDLCSNNDGTGAVNSYTIDHILEGGSTQWYAIKYDTGGALSGSIKSVALTCLLDPGTPTIKIDNILACNDFTLQSLIGKSDSDGYFCIKSINDTTVILAPNGSTTTTSKYAGTGGSATTYRRETIKTTLATTTSTSVQAAQDNGTIGSPITFSGGWNSSDNSQDGVTWFDGLNSFGYGMYCIKNFISFNKIGLAKYSYGFYTYSADTCILTNCYATGNSHSSSPNGGGLYLSSANNIRATDCAFVGNFQNVIIYDKSSVYLKNCRLNSSAGTTTYDGIYFYGGSSVAYVDDCDLRSCGDGTNAVEMFYNSRLYANNCKGFNGTVLTSPVWGVFAGCTLIDGTQNNSKSNQMYGIIASGTNYSITPHSTSTDCAVLDPNSTAGDMELELPIACQASTALSISLYASKSAAGFSGATTLEAYGCGIDFAASALTLGTYTGADGGWTLNSKSLGTPTKTGTVWVKIRVTNSATSGDVYLSTVSTTGGSIDAGKLGVWDRGLPNFGYTKTITETISAFFGG